MTEQEKIQHARDVLAKWRKGVVYVNSIIPLIEGTAANRELLDAIDEVLGTAFRLPAYSRAIDHVATRIAAAIIAADERMNA